MTTRYLQFRVHGLQCVKMSTNVQNFLGIPLETDPNAIDLSAIITDANAGVVAQAPPVLLGTRYNAGHRETFSPPKVVAEMPFESDDTFPQRFTVTVNLAERDDGGGFDQLMETVAHELTEALSREVGSSLDRGVTDSVYYETVERTAENLLEMLFKEIGKLLGLGDDPFTPVTLEHELRSFDAAPSGTGTIEVHEQAPHQGKYILTYGWHVATSRAIVDTSTASRTGATTAALSRAGITPPPYPRPFRSFRFARPMKKRAVKVPVATRPVPLWWHATPIKLFKSAQPK